MFGNYENSVTNNTQMKSPNTSSQFTGQHGTNIGAHISNMNKIDPLRTMRSSKKSPNDRIEARELGSKVVILNDLLQNISLQEENNFSRDVLASRQQP